MTKFLNPAYAGSFIFIISATACCQYSFAQKKDSTEIKSKKNDILIFFYVNEDAFNNKNYPDYYQRVDTSLTGIQKYELLNSKQPFKARFSNSGLAYRNLVFDSKYSFDFVSSRQYFKDYFLTNENAKYYNVSEPFAEVYYMMGPKREQLFDVLFTRNFKKDLNLSAKYKLIHSPGKYLRQKSDDAFVILTANYATKNSRYIVLGNYFYNRIKIQENGGLQNDSSFTENIEPNRQFIAVNLYNAENQLKESGFYIKQLFFLGFGGRKNIDSTKTERPYTGFGRISHSILFKNQSYLYIDGNPMSGFYPAPLLDTAATHDSIHTNTIENTLEWSNLKFSDNSNSQHFIIRLGIMHKFSKLYGYKIDTSLVSLIPQINLKIKIGKRLEVSANSFYFLNGYNRDDYSATGIVTYNYNKDTLSTGYFGVKANIFRQSPAWFDKQDSSNNFSWNCKFGPSYSSSAGLFFNYKKMYVYVNCFRISDQIYYNYNALPLQEKASSDILQVGLNKDFVWKKWALDNKIVYQKTFGANIIRLPEIESNHAIYFTQPFFKKALTAQFGMEVTFFGSYYPNAYMPATREFYLQNDFKSDNYPFIDFFVNLKIKRARIYLKLDHVNSGLMEYNYYMIPHYPMSDRAFRFGVSWMFYD